jgi:hypothetical protein
MSYYTIEGSRELKRKIGLEEVLCDPNTIS